MSHVLLSITEGSMSMILILFDASWNATAIFAHPGLQYAHPSQPDYTSFSLRLVLVSSGPHLLTFVGYTTEQASAVSMLQS